MDLSIRSVPPIDEFSKNQSESMIKPIKIVNKKAFVNKLLVICV